MPKGTRTRLNAINRATASAEYWSGLVGQIILLMNVGFRCNASSPPNTIAAISMKSSAPSNENVGQYTCLTVFVNIVKAIYCPTNSLGTS